MYQYESCYISHKNLSAQIRNMFQNESKWTYNMTKQDMGKRDTTISICKALGIILMVITHSGSPGKLCAFAYEFHMPLFFITAGYFFSLRYLNDEATFIKKRIKGLYIPFIKRSVIFLIIHNWLFKLGILNEKFGNISDDGTNPYG